MAIPLITVRITYSYLGNEVYGLWMSITTFFALFSFSDLGIGNGLQTKLSHANGLNDTKLCQTLITNTYALLFIIALFLFILFVLLFNHIDWARLVNANSAGITDIVNSIVLIIVLSQIFLIPTAIIQRTQYALQEGYKSNLWLSAGSVLSLVFIVIASELNLGKIALIGGASFIPVIIAGLNILYYFYYDRRDLGFNFKLIRLPVIKNLLSLGIYFCILSVLTVIGLSMDTFIVAKTASLEDAAWYSILFRVGAIISGITTIVCLPLWGANGEAFARGDFYWIKKNSYKMARLMVLATVFISCIIILSSKFIFKIWLGSGFEFSHMALVGICLMQVGISFIAPFFMVLNALGKIKIQIIMFACYTPVCFFLKYYMSELYGVTIIPYIGFTLYLFIITYTLIYTKSIFKKLCCNDVK